MVKVIKYLNCIVFFLFFLVFIALINQAFMTGSLISIFSGLKKVDYSILSNIGKKEKEYYRSENFDTENDRDFELNAFGQDKTSDYKSKSLDGLGFDDNKITNNSGGSSTKNAYISNSSSNNSNNKNTSIGDSNYKEPDYSSSPSNYDSSYSDNWPELFNDDKEEDFSAKKDDDKSLRSSSADSVREDETYY